MRSDLRGTVLYGEVEALYRRLWQPGTGQIGDVAEVHGAPDGQRAVFTGTLMEKLEGIPSTRIGEIDLRSGDARILTFGPNVDRLAKYCPTGGPIAFLSDRHEAGDFQLYLLDQISSTARPTPFVEGWVEYLHWSPDGRRILLGVACYGADVAGTQGAVTRRRTTQDIPAWIPDVETGDEGSSWRRAWIYDLATDRLIQVPLADSTIWEAVWCGTASLAVVASPGPKEGLWYSARLYILSIDTGDCREIYAPEDQIGWPAASPSGKHMAIVEAVCSDRWLVAGDLRLIETSSGKVQRIDTKGVSITTSEWRSDQTLLLAGLRGFETVVGLCDVASGSFTEVWGSHDISSAGPAVNVSGLNETGDCILVGESFVRAPEIAVIRKGAYQVVKSFDVGYADEIKAICAVERTSWKAPDGLDIQGWLLLPKGTCPHPLIMNIHGGPVSNWRPVWLGRPRGVPVLMLIKQGYAVLLPNPRGSSGRGQYFARKILSQMGGADTHDLLSALDHLVERGCADPERLGVVGISYGGFMTSWLITQDSRFAAAVAVAPITNWVTEHLVSNIPHFVKLFLSDTYTSLTGKYFQRSPLMQAHKVVTPTLSVCGALDRCTPPGEAIQFHSALVENGVESVLVVYPEEGHGIRSFPAAIDYATRLVAWFQEHMPARSSH